jgi:hypothetical protein
MTKRKRAAAEAAAVTEHERQRWRRPLHKTWGWLKERPLQEAGGGDVGGSYRKRAAVTGGRYRRPLQEAAVTGGRYRKRAAAEKVAVT